MHFGKLKLLILFLFPLVTISCDSKTAEDIDCWESKKQEFEATESRIKEDLLLHLETLLLSSDELVRTASLLAELDDGGGTDISSSNPFYHLLGGLELKCIKEERSTTSTDIYVSTDFSECEGIEGLIQSNFKQSQDQFELSTDYTGYRDVDLTTSGLASWKGSIGEKGLSIISNDGLKLKIEIKCLPEGSCTPRWNSERELENQIQWNIDINTQDKQITINADGQIKLANSEYELKIKDLRYDFLNCSKGADQGTISYKYKGEPEKDFSFQVLGCRSSSLSIGKCTKSFDKKETDQYFLLTLLDIRLIYNQAVGYKNLVKNYQDLVLGNE